MTRSFPGADIGSDHDLVMMTFRVRSKKARTPNQPILSLILRNRGTQMWLALFTNIDTMITTYNTAVTDAASVIFGMERRRKTPWVSGSAKITVGNYVI